MGKSCRGSCRESSVPAALPRENFHPLPPAVPDPPHSPTWWTERHGPLVPTWACHFLQKPPAPLKVGTPLSALTPAPVMMAMCLALANTSRKSAMSVPGQGEQGAVQALTLWPKEATLTHPETASTHTSHDFNFRTGSQTSLCRNLKGNSWRSSKYVYEQAQ